MGPAHISGSIFGVSFDVKISPIGEDECQISGTAGGQPVEIRAKAGDEFVTVTGTLLGNNCAISARGG